MANFHVDSSGNLWLGDTSTTFTTSAPFYVQSDGTVKATSGNIGGISITSSSIQSTNFGASTGFQLNSDGSAVFRNVTISGYATSTEVSTAQSTANSANTAALAAQADADQGILDAASAQSTANTANSTANTANSTASSVDGTVTNIKNNLFYGGTTEINGGTIRTGTISADDITTGTLSLGSASFDSTGLTAVGTVTIAPSNSSSSIGNSLNSLAGYSLLIYGSGEIRGTLTADTLKDRSSSSLIDFASTYIDIKPNNQLKYRFSTAQFTSYDDIRPSPDNTYDLGGSTLRWDDVYATNGTIQTSDVTLKENIKTTDLGLDFVNDLNPIEFTWIDGGVRTHLGFSAQDIKEKLITHKGADQNMAVYTQGSYETQYVEDEDGEWVETDNPIERYGLRSNELIPVLTKAVQELSTQVSDLTARIETLEG